MSVFPGPDMLPAPEPWNEAPAPPRSPSEMIAWAVIAVTLAATLVLPYVLPSRTATTTAPAAGAGTPAPSSREDAIAAFQMKVLGRYFVGLHALSALAPADSTGQGAMPTSQMLDNLDRAAKTPRDQLRAAIVAGELTDAQVALTRIDAVLARPDVPAPLREDAQALRIIYTDGPAALDATTRMRLVQRQSWFLDLALAHGSKDPAQRRAVLAPAIRTMVSLVLLLLAGGTASLAGLVLLILALVRGFSGRLRHGYVPTPPADVAPAVSAVFLEAFALYFGGFVLASLVLRWAWPSAGLNTAWPLTLVPAVALFWPRFRGVSWAQWRQALGWHTGRGWLREIGAGIVGYLTGLPLLALGMIVTMVLVSLTRATPYHPILDEAGRAGLWSALQIVLIASVWAPLIEETMFRGALYHHLRQRGGWLASAVVVGLLFALVHPQGWTAVPALAALGGMFAAIREWRGSIIACMTAHSLHNGVMVAALLLMLR